MITSTPTMAPTQQKNETISSSTGQDIGIAIIAEIMAGIITGLGIVFQKLICFKVFDYYAGATGIATDICSCYRKSWQEAREQYQNVNNNQAQDSQEDVEMGKKDAKDVKKPDDSSILGKGTLPIDLGGEGSLAFTDLVQTARIDVQVPQLNLENSLDESVSSNTSSTIGLAGLDLI